MRDSNNSSTKPASIVKRYLLEGISVSNVCDEHQILSIQFDPQTDDSRQVDPAFMPE